jgi:hypothetical protein
MTDNSNKPLHLTPSDHVHPHALVSSACRPRPECGVALRR